MKQLLLSVLLLFSISVFSQTRRLVSLNTGWTTAIDDTNPLSFEGFEKPGYKDDNWQKVNIPHTWDQYEGYRNLAHGNRHGTAWYRKNFVLNDTPKGKRFFLYFEGVGSYATVFLNGKQVGYHAGGRTTFTLDVTHEINTDGKPNILAVKAEHPANIKDLPWICGGCSTERGFSEGSQPMGIFRPVTLITTADIRVQPFGVHVWNDTTVRKEKAVLYIETELKNYSPLKRNIEIITTIEDKKSQVIAMASSQKTFQAHESLRIRQEQELRNIQLWSPENPYLYSVKTTVTEKGKVLDQQVTPYGIRWISWPLTKKGTKQFMINGKPLFINGIAEYEHLMGNSHAFSDEQILTRVRLVQAAGFNAFRDAHQPHNLQYQDYWDKEGLLWWPQMCSHVWYDSKAFRENFLQLLADWVKERRNSPSVILWGLANESALPESFARECTETIRKLDPTASSQRLVTTCNGGKGTDWNVPQNWSGTYGGDPMTYSRDVIRQRLVGEYGAWRTIDLHTEGPFNAKGAYSENRMAQLMEMKVRLAEAAKDSTTGHFFWLFGSHDNPGREKQFGEGFRELDGIGPVNYKGLFTNWDEPLDVFYMYRANYVPKEKEPMVYIVSHTWPDRWSTPGKKNGIVVYSNCDEVELYNDVNNLSLGRRKRNGTGTHFQWDSVNVRYNVLYAKGYVKGKEVATDCIVLHHLQESPNFMSLYSKNKSITTPVKGYNYIYRVNCGGSDYTDRNGNIWLSDRQQTNSENWGSNSWASDFSGVSAYFASQRRTFDPIKNTADWELFQHFRFGRNKLTYDFPLPNGKYFAELYFIEPWLGTGGSLDATGMRLFDVSFNGDTLIKNLDIWKEAGHDAALKKTVEVIVTGGRLTISFPEVKSGQAVISAIAIASADKNIKPALPSPLTVVDLEGTGCQINSWLDTGNKLFTDDKSTFVTMPSYLYGKEQIVRSKNNVGGIQFRLSHDADIYIGLLKGVEIADWMKGFESMGNNVSTTFKENTVYNLYRKRCKVGLQIAIGNVTVPASVLVFVSPSVTSTVSGGNKNATLYKAADAILTGNGISKELFLNRRIVKFSNPSGDILEWTIKTGIADTYTLTIKYHNPVRTPLTAQIEVLTDDGVVLKKAETVQFAPSSEGIWNTLVTTTGTMINAGSYKVRLKSVDAQNLLVESLEIQ